MEYFVASVALLTLFSPLIKFSFLFRAMHFCVFPFLRAHFTVVYKHTRFLLVVPFGIVISGAGVRDIK